jgi:hypothetical protein
LTSILSLEKPVTFSPPLPRSLHLGLFSTSGNRDQVGTARFAGVAIEKL